MEERKKQKLDQIIYNDYFFRSNTFNIYDRVVNMIRNDFPVQNPFNTEMNVDFNFWIKNFFPYYNRQNKFIKMEEIPNRNIQEYIYVKKKNSFVDAFVDEINFIIQRFDLFGTRLDKKR